jgi:hypothetical protein
MKERQFEHLVSLRAEETGRVCSAEFGAGFRAACHNKRLPQRFRSKLRRVLGKADEHDRKLVLLMTQKMARR